VLWRQLSSPETGWSTISLHALFGYPGPELDFANPRYSLWTLDPAGGLAVRLADDHLPRGLAADPAGHVRGGQPRRRPAAGRQFWKITLPLLTPVVFFNAVIQTIEAFKSFTPAFVISGRHRRADRLDAVLHALPVPGGVRRTSAWATPRRWPGSWCCWSQCFTALLVPVGSKYWVHYDD
jgi:multiple sugar transport system permease protein